MFSAVRRHFRFWHGDLRLVQIHTPVACVGFSCQCFATTSPTWRFCLGFDFAATHQWCASACSWHPRLSLEWVRWPSITAYQRTSSIDYTRSTTRFIKPIWARNPKASSTWNDRDPSIFKSFNNTTNALTNQLGLLRMEIDVMSTQLQLSTLLIVEMRLKMLL